MGMKTQVDWMPRRGKVPFPTVENFESLVNGVCTGVHVSGGWGEGTWTQLFLDSVIGNGPHSMGSQEHGRVAKYWEEGVGTV